MEGRYRKHNHASGEWEVPGSSWSFSLSSLPDSCLRFCLSVPFPQGQIFFPKMLGLLLPNFGMPLTFVFPTYTPWQPQLQFLYDSIFLSKILLPSSAPRRALMAARTEAKRLVHTWLLGLHPFSRRITGMCLWWGRGWTGTPGVCRMQS